MTSIYKIVYVGDPVSITKKDGTSCQKQMITVREIEGKFANQYVATYFSENGCSLTEGTVIAASLRFNVRTYEGMDYQDITMQEYVVLGFSSPPKLPTVPSVY